MVSRKSASFAVLPRFRMWSFLLTLSAVSLMMGLPAHADVLAPTSYNMIGGGTSSLNTTLWDRTYPQTSNYQTLAGSKGDLTDGIVTTLNWGSTPNAPDVYVGWYEWDVRNPTIIFHFGNPVVINHIDIHGNDGYKPGSVDFTIGSNTYHFQVFQTAVGAANWYGFDLPSALIGESLTMTLNDRTFADKTGFPTDWIMIDEVTFNGSAVPIPGAVWLLGSGLIGLGGWRRFRKS
jgi:hypothetical protein